MMIFESKLSAGLLLGERYRITLLIGSGGMSYVYLAEDMRLPGQRWAVKESVSLHESYGEVTAEAELLISLNHRLLPRVADFFPPDEQGYCYLVMDYIEGVTLAEYIRTDAEPLEGEEIVAYTRQLLEVLRYLHGQHPPIIYRDLKPANIMLTGGGSLMLIDFGIARSYRRGAGEDTEKLGTAGFAAPEQYGSGQSGAVSDLYGLGAIMLYMASGGLYSRWEPGMEARLSGRIPPGLVPVIRRLQRFHPEERYQSAAEVEQALQPLIEAVTVPGRPMKRLTSSMKQETAVVALIGVAAGLGTTHTSLAVSSCLARKGTTAWVDLSPDASVYATFRSMLDDRSGTVQPGAPAALRWKGIDLWPRPAEGDIASLLDKGYTYIVLDLGSGGSAECLAAFAGSDIPLLVASGAGWRLEEMLRWLRRSRLMPGREWRMVLPLADRQSAELLSAALGGRLHVCSLPLQQDPFQRNGKLVQVLDQLLTGTGKLHVPVKRSGIFQKKT